MSREKILIGKLGKSIRFNPAGWGAVGGDNEAPLLFEKLIHNKPDTDFYLLGSSDFKTLDIPTQNRINKHGNLYDLWEINGYTKFKQSYPKLKKKEVLYKFLREVLVPKYKDADYFDAGIFVFGMVARINIPWKCALAKTPNKLASPLDALSLYAGPGIEFLNDVGTPWVGILNDPRSHNRNTSLDMLNRPEVILSQLDDVIKARRYTDYLNPEAIEFDEKIIYSGLEKMFLLNDNLLKPGESTVKESSLGGFFDDEEETVENSDFIIVCNEGRPSRYKDLKKYILDKVDDIDIYGAWQHEDALADPRFKGSIKFHELQEKLASTKYTFCISIAPKWATSKFWEMAYYGIIPFLHPDYDTQKNIKCPDFIRVKDAADLFKKIQILEDNPEVYEKLKEKIQSMITEEDRNGIAITETVFSHVDKIKKVR